MGASIKKVGLALTALGLMLTGCSAAQMKPAAPAVAQTEPVARGATRRDATAVFHDGNWGVVTSRRHGVALPLPDFSSWRVQEPEHGWSRAVHVLSRAELRWRVWQRAELVRIVDCQRDAEAWVLTPKVEEAETLSESSRQIAEFATWSVAWVNRSPERTRSSASLLVIGARLRSCLALSFVGGDRLEEPAQVEQLVWVEQRILPRIGSLSVDMRAGRVRQEPSEHGLVH